MARNAGRNGQLYMGLASNGTAESVAYIKKWSADFSTDQFEVTAFGDAGKTYVAGLPDGSFQFEGVWDDATVQSYTAAVDGVARKFYFYPKTAATSGPYWFGTGFADFSIDVPVDGAVTISGSVKAATPFTKVG